MGERNWSISDRFIYVMGEIQKLEGEYDNNDPIRFAKNKMKQAAERVLYEATITANEIIESCRRFEQETKEAVLSANQPDRDENE